jgi:hypothetical protein
MHLSKNSLASLLLWACCLQLPVPVLAQQPAARQRQFAPGVVTTIPPKPENEEMYSGPRPLVELPLAIPGLEYDPKLASKSSTIFARAKEATLRRTIWNLEFSFKPMRMLYVDIPQPTNRMQRQLVWYMVYRVRNLGKHIQPLEKPEEVKLESGDTVRTNVTFERGTTDEVELFGRKTKDLRFFPHFVLASTEYDKEYLDRVIPAALAPIKAREFPGRPNQKLYDSLTISEAAIPISTETEDHSVWGLVTWTNIDPRIDYFVVYVQGLTNAYRFEDPAGAYKAGDPPGAGRKLTKKTLQLNFWRPGDTVDPNEEELRYGCRVDADPADLAKILAEYGIDKPIDHTWVYRSTEPPTQAAAAPAAPPAAAP